MILREREIERERKKKSKLRKTLESAPSDLGKTDGGWLRGMTGGREGMSELGRLRYKKRERNENIYRLLLREQELRETRYLYEEIHSRGGARNYFKFYSSNI